MRVDAIPAPPRGARSYVTKHTARRAVEMAMPMLEAGRLDRQVVGSGFLHVVVLDPGLTPAHACLTDAILYEQSFGDPEQWDTDYAAFARAKAALTWHTQLDSHRIQALSPHLLSAGDTALWGSVWLDGIVVGVSGAFPWFDEAYAGTIALLVRALAKEAREADSGKLFLSQPEGQVP